MFVAGAATRIVEGIIELFHPSLGSGRHAFLCDPHVVGEARPPSIARPRELPAPGEPEALPDTRWASDAWSPRGATERVHWLLSVPHQSCHTADLSFVE